MTAAAVIPKEPFSQKFQREEAESIQSEETREEEERQQQFDFDSLRYLKIPSDTLKFDRDSVMERVTESLRIAKPEHRKGNRIE